MMKNQTTLFGYTTRLIIEDEHGEYEVANALKLNQGNGEVRVDADRVLDAIDKRLTRFSGRRPVL